MFSFTKEELEARVASLLEGTTLSIGATWVGGLFQESLFVEIHLPVGFRLVSDLDHRFDWPVLGQFSSEEYFVLQAPDTVGRGKHVLCFPWLGGKKFGSYKIAEVEALGALFRIPI